MKFLNFLNPANAIKRQICSTIEAELYKELCSKMNTYYQARAVDGIAMLDVCDTETRQIRQSTPIQTIIDQYANAPEIDTLRSFIDIEKVLPTIGARIADALKTKQLIAVKGKKRAIFHVIDAGNCVKKDVKLIELLEDNA